MKGQLKLVVILFFYSIISCCNNFSDNRTTASSYLNNREKDTSENFLIFLRDFSISPEFQVSRIKFPLQYCYLTEEHVDTCNQISQHNWKTIPLIDTGKGKESIDLVYDNFGKEFRKTGERVFASQGIENDISNYYYFKLLKGKWYLIKVEDFSY